MHESTLLVKGRNLLHQPARRDLFILLFSTFATRFNWGYFDGFKSRNIGQLGFAYTLFLLSKYGDIIRPDSFCSLKYSRAFPSLLEEEEPLFPERDPQDTLNRCNSVRTFQRFLSYFNVIEIHSQHKFTLTGNISVRKTHLFGKVFFFRD